MKCSSESFYHFTFDKGKSDCEVFLYLMTGRSIFVSLYIYGVRSFIFKSVQIVEVIVSSDIIVHFRKAPIIHLSKFHFLGIIHIFRVDGCTYKELLISIAVFYKKDGEIYKPFLIAFFPE